VIDADALAKLVASGEMHYVLWGGNRGGPGGPNSSITSYLQTSCTVVSGASLGSAGGMRLYQCGA
jgi:hypothetical protein